MELKKNVLNEVYKNQSDNDCNVFIDEIMSIYKSELKLNSKLPTMILNAKTLKIANGLTKHLKFTQEHLLRLETLFKSINQPIKS